MSVPNVDATSDAFYKVKMATNAPPTDQNTHTYKVNGAQLALDTVPNFGGDYSRVTAQFQFSNPSPSMTLEIVVNRSSPSILTSTT